MDYKTGVRESDKAFSFLCLRLHCPDETIGPENLIVFFVPLFICRNHLFDDYTSVQYISTFSVMKCGEQ